MKVHGGVLETEDLDVQPKDWQCFEGTHNHLLLVRLSWGEWKTCTNI